MHALSHSLSHRGPSASTRTRSRWQPYASTSSIPPPTRSPAPYLVTPTSSVSTSPPHSSISAPQDVSRQAIKSRYVTSLIDQTVKSLCEIWQPYQLPSFTPINHDTPTLPQGSCIFSSNLVLNLRNTQLPSPISPSLQPESPFLPTTTGQSAQSCAATPTNPVPLKSFVQEVLRRSRTSGSVLQTALCYLEAVRRKVPEIAREETAFLEASQREAALDRNGMAYTPSPERPLSSPLLCPRRTFLASLILASKFLQDRCYSNRAWAKLSGLSPREIGRCEKALGDALEWRLWVGKGTGRPFVRSRSEHTVAAITGARGATGRILARSRTVPCMGVDLQPIQETESLDPYQEWLVLNQSRLDAEEAAAIPDAAELTPVPSRAMDLDRMSTPLTPSLILSPTLTVCSSESALSFDSDEGERTIQVSDISDPFLDKISGWYGNEVRVVDPTTIEYAQLATPHGWC